MDVQYHVAGGIANGRVRVRGGIIEFSSYVLSVPWYWVLAMEPRATSMVTLTEIS